MTAPDPLPLADVCLLYGCDQSNGIMSTQMRTMLRKKSPPRLAAVAAAIALAFFGGAVDNCCASPASSSLSWCRQSDRNVGSEALALALASSKRIVANKSATRAVYFNLERAIFCCSSVRIEQLIVDSMAIDFRLNIRNSSLTIERVQKKQ